MRATEGAQGLTWTHLRQAKARQAKRQLSAHVNWQQKQRCRIGQPASLVARRGSARLGPRPSRGQRVVRATREPDFQPINVSAGSGMRKQQVVGRQRSPEAHPALPPTRSSAEEAARPPGIAGW